MRRSDKTKIVTCAEKDRLLLANSKSDGAKDDSSEVKRLKERVKIVEEALRAMRDEVRRIAQHCCMHPCLNACIPPLHGYFLAVR